jgi:hypothetical protein
MRKVKISVSDDSLTIVGPGRKTAIVCAVSGGWWVHCPSDRDNMSLNVRCTLRDSAIDIALDAVVALPCPKATARKETI